jgi:hypothetical protein
MEVSTLNRRGIVGGGYRDGKLLHAQLSSPADCACDAEGNVYVADEMNHRIRKVTANGVVDTFAGDGIAGYQAGGLLRTGTRSTLN